MPVCDIYLFGSDAVVTPFLQCCYSDKKAKVTIGSKNYNLKIYSDVQWIKANFFKTKETILIGDAVIVLFSFDDPDSSEYVRKKWNTSYMKSYNPTTPVILVGCNIEDSNDKKLSEKLANLKNKQICIKMGKQLARRINATKYLECPTIDETNLQDIFEEVVRTSIYYRNLIHTFRIFVIGKKNSGKTEMIRQFVCGNRLNVFEECLNDQPNFSDHNEHNFSTHIEINGEEFHLLLKDAENSNEIFSSSNWYFWDNEVLKRYRFVDAVILVFSVIEPDSINATSKSVVRQIRKFDDVPEYPIPIILIGNQTDFRNDYETLSDLSQQGKRPITFEIGEHLARETNAVKYLECSSSDEMGIANVLEEVVWASLRRFQKMHRLMIQEKVKQKRGFFKRLFGW